MKEDTNRTRDGNSHGNMHRMKKVAALLVVFTMAALLASCAEDTGDATGSSAAAPSGSGTSMEGTTGGTTMSGTTMGGTTTGAMMGGETTDGTTMSGTTSESPTMSTTGDETTAGTTMGGTTSGATSGDTLTSIQSIVSETDKASLAGRRVQLEGVEVRSSIGNAGFLAGSPGADQILVVPAEQVNAEQGQTANIEGTLREVPGISEAQQQLGVSEEVAALIQSQVVYLDAEQVQ